MKIQINNTFYLRDFLDVKCINYFAENTLNTPTVMSVTISYPIGNITEICFEPTSLTTKQVASINKRKLILKQITNNKMFYFADLAHTLMVNTADSSNLQNQQTYICDLSHIFQINEIVFTQLIIVNKISFIY